MPNSPQAGSEMLNNMVASFTASNQIGEQMKKAAKEKEAEENEKNTNQYKLKNENKYYMCYSDINSLFGVC